MTRSPISVLVLDLRRVLETGSLWATAGNGEDDLVVGLINLKVLGEAQ